MTVALAVLFGMGVIFLGLALLDSPGGWPVLLIPGAVYAWVWFTNR